MKSVITGTVSYKAVVGPGSGAGAGARAETFWKLELKQIVSAPQHWLKSYPTVLVPNINTQLLDPILP
jgi:hypothetical protein